MRHLVASVVLVLLSGLPALAGDLRAAAARHGALAAQPAPRTEIPPRLKRTAIGLLVGGGATLLTGILVRNGCGDLVAVGPVVPGSVVPNEECRHAGLVVQVAGGVLAGTGATLFAIGRAKRRPVSPSITMQPGRVLVQQRVSF
jgi:hypothetical protein